MTRDGQRELILEQRHLLGVFFAVVILGGLSFAAGFIMGRNRGADEASARFTSVNAAIPQEPRWLARVAGCLHRGDSNSGDPRLHGGQRPDLRSALRVPVFV